MQPRSQVFFHLNCEGGGGGGGRTLASAGDVTMKYPKILGIIN